MNTTAEILCTRRISSSVQIKFGVGERCVSQSDSLVRSVEDTVESLKGSRAKNERRSSCGVANIIYNQINLISNTTHDSVKVLRHDLSVRSECEGNLVKKRK